MKPTGDEWIDAKVAQCEEFERRCIEVLDREKKVNTENTEQTFEDAVLAEMNNILTDLRKMATAVNRGTGGREIALAITNMQQSQFWLVEAKKVIAEGGKP